MVFIQTAGTAVYSAGYNVLGTVMNNSTVENSGFAATDKVPTSLETVNTIEKVFGTNAIANQGGVSDVIAPLADAAPIDIAAVKATVNTWPIDEMAKVMDLDKDQRGYTRAATSVAGSYDPNGIAPDDEEEGPKDALETVSAHAFQTGVYSLLGQYLGDDVTVLPAGIYICNGQKIVKQ